MIWQHQFGFIFNLIELIYKGNYMKKTCKKCGNKISTGRICIDCLREAVRKVALKRTGLKND